MITASNPTLQLEVLNTLLDSMSDGLTVHDEFGRITQVNSKFLDLIGVPKEKAVHWKPAKCDWISIREDGTEIAVEDFPVIKALKTGQKQPESIIGLVAPNREAQWLSIKAAPLFSNNGQSPSGALVVYTDVTELTKSRSRLKQEDENLNLLSRNLPGMVHELEVSVDGRMRSTYASPGSKLLYEVAPDEIVNGDLILMKMMDPEHQEGFFKKLKSGIDDPSQQQLSWTGRFTMPSGDKKWILVRFNVSRLPNGSTRVHSFHLDVTEKIRLESEVKLSKERFEMAVYGSNSGIWDWDLMSENIWFSDVCKTMLGYDAGRFELNQGACLSLVHPEDYISIFKLIGEALPARRETVTLDCRLKAADGSYRWIQVRAKLIYNDVGHVVRCIGWNIDIHEQKTLSQRLELITETIEEVFWMSDPSTGFTKYVSPGYEKIWKDSISRILEKPGAFMERVHPEDLRIVEEFNRNQKSTECQARYRIRWPDGTIRWIQDKAFPVRKADGKIEMIVGVACDVTHEVETESLLEKQRSQVVNAAKMSALGMMAAGVAHEINNPLAIISGRAQQILDQAQKENFDSKALIKHADAIDRTAHRIAKIIRGLRSFAREADSDPMEKVPVQMIVEDALSLCQARFANHGIQLQCDPVDPNLTLRCRPTQVGQMLLNLLNNAFDAVEDKPIKSVRLAVSVQMDRIEFRVIDNGAGIHPEARQKIMQPFFTTKQVGRGTGLGLSIVEGLAKAHNGSLWLDEEHPQTCFVVELPR